ncbi:zinc finger protein 431 [Lingula anatina]|uniref:Zinc finger protein 431 n=1 Tax=Lingula anatina TaxID=7574 RepID=A0A1S3KAX5_LINAN|nr:zinc finger protein 431 [Lingula anatina]|eukprot:XP_013419803.1 zinc finger protein 431 [Lingula anatina]
MSTAGEYSTTNEEKTCDKEVPVMNEPAEVHESGPVNEKDINGADKIPYVMPMTATTTGSSSNKALAAADTKEKSIAQGCNPDSDQIGLKSFDAAQNKIEDCATGTMDAETSSASSSSLDNGPQFTKDEVTGDATRKSDNSVEHVDKCLICGPPTGTSRIEYTKLSSCPEIQNEICELLKILSPPDDSDVCCDRCLGLMKNFVRLKNEYLNMKRKIIALHIDAQLDLRESCNNKVSESEVCEITEPTDKINKPNYQEQNCAMLVKHENIDLGFDDDSDSTEEEVPQKRKRENPPRRKTFKCQNCDKIFRRKDELVVHERTHTGERPFKCQFCDSSFHRKNICVKHEKKHLDKPFRCKYCVRIFSTREECEEHENTHTLIRPYQCLHCGKTFARKGESTLHERTHTGERPFKCEHCDKRFFRKNACVKHEKKTHKGLVSTRKTVSSSEKTSCKKMVPQAGPFKCSQCDKTFKKKWESIAHERIHTGERPFQCQHCEKTFIRKNSCVKHEKKHSIKSFNCSHCGKICLGKRALDKHEKTHFGGKPYKCRGCDKTFAWRTQWEEHERIHTGEKPFLCQFCDKRFTQSSTCLLHERTQHTGERPFKCQYCDQAFATKGYREVHERYHTGEKPFKCSYCGKAFIRKGNCRDHERTHTGIKPYVCLYCGKGFFDKSDCVVHERIHTGERPFKCQFCDKTYTTKKHCIQHERTHSGGKAAKKQTSGSTLKNVVPDHAYKLLDYNNKLKNLDMDGTFKSQHSENTFRTPLPDHSYLSQHPSNLFGNQQPDNNTFRGPHSSSAFPTPEVVYPPGDNPYLYGMYMPGV